MSTLMSVALGIYVVAMLAASIYARRRVKSEGDFLVAGRRLSLPFASATLFATWFGAGTLLTATDEIADMGFHASLMEPFGAGFCLIIAGLFFAGPLWRLKLTTIADLFERAFGLRAGYLAIILYTPCYMAWIAVQLMSAAQVLHIITGVGVILCLLMVAALVMTYTLLGGMWSIALMDIVQVGLIIVGLSVLLVAVVASLGGGSVSSMLSKSLGAQHEDLWASDALEKLRRMYRYLTLFLVGSLGNIPGQDFAQRVFASKSEAIAKRACLIAGIAYVTVGLIPVSVALLFKELFPKTEPDLVLLFMAQSYVSPVLFVIITIAILAAIFSTLDSSLLATAAPISHNILPKVFRNTSKLLLYKMTVVGITCACVFFAAVTPDLFVLLEASYSSGIAIFFVPVAMALFSPWLSEKAALNAMFIGTIFWILDIIYGATFFSLAIPGGLAALLAYLTTYTLEARITQPAVQKSS